MKYILVLLLLSTTLYADPICLTGSDDEDINTLYRETTMQRQKIEDLQTDMARVKDKLNMDKPLKLKAPEPYVAPKPVDPAFIRPAIPLKKEKQWDGPQND